MKRKFYFHKRDNRFLILFFVIIILINVIAILSNEGVLEQFNMILSAILILPFGVLLKKDEQTSYKRIGNGSSNNREKSFVGAISDINETDLKEGKIIDRTSHQDSIVSLINSICTHDTKNKFKGIILTGDSGSGKSILIENLKMALESNNYQVMIKKEYYNYSDISFSGNKTDKKRVIFLDQFERVFTNTSFIQNMLEDITNIQNNCVFVFAFPQSDLSRIKNLFVKNGIDHVLNNIYVLSLNDDDIEKYKNKIAVFSNVDFNHIKDYIVGNSMPPEIVEGSDCKKLCDELIRVINGEAPLIELELLGYILSFDNSEFKTYNRKYSFIDIYIDEWVNQFTHPETAYAIIYLLSEYGTYSVDDIRLASFESKDNFVCNHPSEEDGAIIQALNENFLISSNRKRDNVLAFEAAHQYIADQFRKYCQHKEIPENLKYYIDHLRRCIESKNIRKEYNDSYKSIKKRYSKFHSKHTGIYIMMAIMYIAVMIVNILKYESNNYVHYQMIAISIVDLPSIYYIYNYCMRFFLISDNCMIKLTYIIGPIVIALSYICINAWGILLGAEIVVLSLAIIYTHYSNTLGIANRSFKKDFIVFISIGIATMALGVIHYNIFSTIDLHNNEFVWFTIYGYSNYAVFLIYVTLSVFNHTRYSYMIGRIGLSNICK